MSESDHRYLVNAEAAIYRDDEYLLIERAPTEDHAAGTLGLVGGTVEATEMTDVLEGELAREIREEVSVEIADPQYVQSNAFTTDGGTPCVNVVFLCHHDGGEPGIAAPEEVAAIEWLSVEDALGHPVMSPWTAEFLGAADERRAALGW